MTKKLVIGIKTFAGGRITSEEALDYVYKMTNSCMIGIGSVDEAKKDFEIIKRVMKK